MRPLVGRLLVDGRDVAAPVRVATSFGSRLRGLIGARSLNGALLLPSTSSVHGFGLRFAIDLAYLDHEGCVLEVGVLEPWRATLPRRRADAVLEAERGAFARWGLAVGAAVEVGA